MTVTITIAITITTSIAITTISRFARSITGHVHVTTRTIGTDISSQDDFSHRQTIAVDDSIDLAGVTDGEDEHDESHEESVEDVEAPFVRDGVSMDCRAFERVRGLHVFGHTVAATGQDHFAGCEEGEHISLPWHGRVGGRRCGFAPHTEEEDCGDEEENQEEDDLQTETEFDHVVARLERLFCLVG